MTKEAQALALILPNGIFDWFEITDSVMDNEGIKIVFQEKNVPPVSAAQPDTKIETKGFTEITITDFPIRGKKTLLTFRRRYWQIAGAAEYLKRDIELCFPGTQLATEFANFLKEKSRSHPDVAREYRRYALPGGQGI